jgi:hypothetical protein
MRRKNTGKKTLNVEFDEYAAAYDTFTAAQEASNALRAAAMSGDIVMTITPETVTPAPTSAAWTRDVVVSIENAAGDVHTWLTQDYTTTVSIADTSTAGTASIASTTLSISEGVATITVSGDAADWLDTETDTLTIGNITVMGYTVSGGTSVETFTTV